MTPPWGAALAVEDDDAAPAIAVTTFVTVEAMAEANKEGWM